MLPEAVLAFGQYAFSLKMWSRHMDGTPDSAGDTEKNFISCPAGFENIVSLSYFARQHGAGKKNVHSLKATIRGVLRSEFPGNTMSAKPLGGSNAQTGMERRQANLGIPKGRGPASWAS